MLKKFINRNWKKIYKIELYSFIIFITMSFSYYFYKPAHKYFNSREYNFNFISTISWLMNSLFVLFLFIIICYPIIYIIQLIYLKSDNNKINKHIILFILYFLTFISVLLLLSIILSGTVKNR